MISKTFRLNGKYLFLTYPQSRVQKTELELFLIKKLKNVRYILISQETHEDGGKHLHAYVQLSVRCDFTSPKCLDIDGHHGDYKTAKGTYQQIYDYLTKEDKEPLIYGIPDKNAGDKSAETKAGIREKNEKIINGDLKQLVEDGDIYIGIILILLI